MKTKLPTVVLTALLLIFSSLAFAAPDKDTRRVQTVARQLEAQADNLYSLVQKLHPKADGPTRTAINRLQSFENNTDHFRIEVTNKGVFSGEARRQLTLVNRAWRDAQPGFRYLINDRRITSYRSAIDGMVDDLARIYGEDRDGWKNVPLEELASQAAAIVTRSERMVELARREMNDGRDRFNRNAYNLGYGKLTDVQSYASTLERSVRQRPYRDPEVRRDLQDLEDAFQRAERPVANFSGRVRSEFLALGQLIARFDRLLAGRRQTGGYAGQFPYHDDGAYSSIWRSENATAP